MTITKTQNGSNLEIALEGRLDTNTAPQLDKELRDSMESARSLTLDFSKLNYISSAGLRVLLTAHKEMAQKDGMKVKGANRTIRDVFDVTGFSDMLTLV